MTQDQLCQCRFFVVTENEVDKVKIIKCAKHKSYRYYGGILVGKINIGQEEETNEKHKS